MEKICVAVRVRPPVTHDSSTGAFWKVDDNRISLHKSHGTPISGISYAFDHVFDEGCTNSRVYELLTKDIIHAAVEGFNGTAFAYGQTSSGKTFTMNGSETDPGIIHRAVRDVFDRIQLMSHREFLIRVSYMELYNEEINDLFAVENQKLQIHESLERGIFVAGLREEIVSNAEQVLKLIESGEVNRHFGETNMNARSSRSHTIFRMVIESHAKDTTCSSTDAIRVSVLNLVDLAGSERIAKTGAGGVRLKEGKYINKSLMILGNVINKLSDGAKNRGHIPYRDSKLTRILQPALGGNAKTSIICTIAPEEVHIEETKGTLQFASRAKRITNCAQVNEILTDAALLKRQKQEIEELRMKLQGSHAGVLEQEILKLRNDMLQYELEREKLEMELEEQRKSHKQREQSIRDQQMKTDNLGSLSTTSDFERSSSQAQDSGRQSLKEVSSDSSSKSQGDIFSTPSNFKAAPHSFVVKRSNYSQLPSFSPLPDAFSNVVDEDTWFKMNKGFIADLDSLQITPARKVQSFPPSDETPGSNENYKHEVHNLKRQLELAVEERDDLKRKHAEQAVLNDQLVREISELQKEAQLIRDIPQRLCECAATCKDIYVDVLSKTQSFISDEKSSAATLLSSISEIGTSLFTTLEAQFSAAFDEDQGVLSRNSSLIEEQRKILSERLNSTIKLFVSSEPSSLENEQVRNSLCCNEYKDRARGGETACWEEKLSNELSTIKGRYHGLEEELDSNNQLLEKSKQRYDAFEAEFRLLKEERDSLHKKVSESSQTLALVTDQKENVVKDLNHELLRRKDLEEKIEQFRVAFGCRKTSLMSFHSEFKSKIESLRAQNPVSVPKSVGC
ncbi:centromere-associated protein E-like [Pyrus ussuriensis x Pyrus communis]|uniref:Kinesin-like protein n=1 Tax=Pyrus ussuriensis x Pyrus communis TaxID=2448454 RepID=A0A5N5HNJ4_9ROSA|nr:centromere-associated protein E-like [Pyrus ussuriensis x Pyrus communis]